MGSWAPLVGAVPLALPGPISRGEHSSGACRCIGSRPVSAPVRPAVLMALALLVFTGAGLRGRQAAHPRLAHESVDERVYATLARTLSEDLAYGDPSSGQRHPFI